MEKIKKYNINFDINKTVIFGDAAKSQEIESSLIESMANFVWGHIEENNFIIDYKTLLTSKPSPNLINLNKYIEKLYPLKTIDEIKDDKERAIHNYNLKITTHFEYKKKFFSKTGNGYVFNKQYENILKNLKAPDNIEDKFFVDLYYSFNKGYIFLFKSVFNLIINLIEKQKEGILDFLVIFRTFGQDYMQVVKELNKFFIGKHPLFPNFKCEKFILNDNKDNIKKENDEENLYNFAVFYRYDICSYLVLGENTRIEKPENPEKLLEIYKGKKIISGARNIYNYMKNKSGFLIISDDYEYWEYHDRKTKYGKLMYIDKNDKNTFNIFFDDNVKSDEKNIISCIDVDTENEIEYKEIINKYIVKANPCEGAMNDNYFLEKIKEILG